MSDLDQLFNDDVAAANASLDAKEAEINTHGYGLGDFIPVRRPPIEHYLRCTITFGAWVVEPGLEYHAGEKLSALLDQLQRCAREAWNAAPPVSIDDLPELNHAFRSRVEALWSVRAWFLEVHHEVAGWTQIFQPYGVPRWR